jgi:hypothetical protein
MILEQLLLKPVDVYGDVSRFLSTLYPQNINIDTFNHKIFLRKELKSFSYSATGKTEKKTSFHNLAGNGRISSLAETLAKSRNEIWHVCINGYGQGTTKDKIQFGTVLQFESDDSRSLDDKLDDWKVLGLPVPTLQMWTGNKSIHSYWVLKTPLPIQKLHELQIQLFRQGKELEADGWAQSDTSWGSTASKTMRVPGFAHPKSGNKSQIINVSSQYYDAQDIWQSIYLSGRPLRGQWDEKSLAFLPWISLEDRIERDRIDKERKRLEAQVKSQRNDLYPIPFSLISDSKKETENEISILSLISQANLIVFKNGSVHGEKNKDSSRLANDLIGCEAWALERNYKLSETACDLFFDYSRRSNIPDSETSNRYNCLKNSNPTPANFYLEDKVLRLFSSFSNRKPILVKKIEVKSKSADLGWDFIGLVNQLFAINKHKDAGLKELLLKKWIEEETSKNTLGGWFAFGDLKEVKKQMVSGEINLVSSESKLQSASGIYPTDVLYCQSPDFKNIAKHFSWYLEPVDVSRELIKYLYLAGAGNKVYVVDESKIKWGAGHYFYYTDESIKPDISLNQRYLLDSANPFFIPEGTRILGMKSEMGTGKTTWLADYIKQTKLRPLAIYSRVTLTQDVADKFGIVFYKETTGDSQAYNQYLKNGTALCCNSLKQNGYINFNPDDWGNFNNKDILLLDEVEATLETICNSSTIKKNRGEIQNNFIKLIKNILSPNSTSILVLSDANLKQSTIDLIQSLSGWNPPKCIIENSWKFEGGERNAYIYENPADFLGQLTIRSKTEDRLYITSDTRECKSENSYLTTEAIALGLQELKEKSLRIDQWTQHTIDDPSYGLGSNARVIMSELKHERAHLITSPTLSAGVSFDDKNGSDFSSVWGAFKGVVPLEGLQQQLERERRNVDRHIYLTDVGKPNGCNPLTSEQSLLDEETLSQLLNVKGIASGLSVLNPDYGFIQAEQISEKMLVEEDSSLAFWRRKNRIGSSFASRNLKINLIAQLKKRGYNVITVKSLSDTEDKKKGKEEIDFSVVAANSKLEIEKLHKLITSQQETHFKELGIQSLKLFQACAAKQRETKLNAIIRSDADIVTEELLRKSDRTAEEHYAVLKFQYLQWSRGIDCTVDNYECWEKKKKEIETGFINYCELTQNENAKLDALKKDSFQPSTGNRSKKDVESNYAKYKLLADNLGLAAFVVWAENSENYSIQMPEVKDFNKKLLEYCSEIKALMGIQISFNDEKAISNIGNILRACGRTQEKVKQSRADGNGKRIRAYSIKTQPNLYLQFWETWATDKNKESLINETKTATLILKKNLENKK